jgi:DNA-binding NtrC family response regulator
MTMKKGTILIVEDHINVLKALVQLLEPEFEPVLSTTDPGMIPGMLSENSIDIVLLDMNFSAGLNTGEEGIFWLKKILDHDRDIIVVMITAYGDVELAVTAMKNGATDFILKPWDNEKLLATMRSAYKLTRLSDLQKQCLMCIRRSARLLQRKPAFFYSERTVLVKNWLQERYTGNHRGRMKSLYRWIWVH